VYGQYFYLTSTAGTSPTKMYYYFRRTWLDWHPVFVGFGFLNLIFWIVFCRSSSFGHCLSYGFWLPLWYLQIFSVIVLLHTAKDVYIVLYTSLILQIKHFSFYKSGIMTSLISLTNTPRNTAIASYYSLKEFLSVKIFLLSLYFIFMRK